jgi:hypothetical protein
MNKKLIIAIFGLLVAGLLETDTNRRPPGFATHSFRTAARSASSGK